MRPSPRRAKKNWPNAPGCLALNAAHYRQKYGALPLEEQEKLLNATEIDPETAKLLSEGLWQLISSLAVVMGDGEASEKIEAMKGRFH
jgi:hypothetical protein